MPDDPKPPGVSLSPSAMTDSVSEWPLSRVVDTIKKKVKGEDKPTVAILFCRSSVKSLLPMIDELAASYGVSRNQMSSALSYHGLSLARDDGTITQMSSVCAEIRRVALLEDDTDTLDMMNSLLPFSPRIMEECRFKLAMFDWVSSSFEELSTVCCVSRSWLVQVYQMKSVLTDDVTLVAGIAARFNAEVARWDKWMGTRLALLERLQKG